MNPNSDIKEAGYGKRLLAYFLDALFTVLLFLLAYINLTNRFIAPAMGATTQYQECCRFMNDSSLETAYDSDRNVVQIGDESTTISYLSIPSYSASAFSASTSGGTSQSKPGYALYYQQTWYYYTHFLYADSTAKTPRAVALKKADGTNFLIADYFTYFEETVLGLPAISTITDVNDESQLRQKASVSYFKYALNATGTAPDPLQRPVLVDDLQKKVDAGDTTSLETLNTYFYNASGNAGDYGLFGNAVIDCQGGSSSRSSLQTYYFDRYTFVNYVDWLCRLIAFVPCHLIFFFLIPLLDKEGRTCGKMIWRMAVVKSDGLALSKKERIIRPLLLSVAGLLFLLPSTDLGLIIYLLFCLVDYLILCLSKSKQSLQDKWAKTLVVLSKESRIFVSEEERQAYHREHDETVVDGKDNTAAKADSILDLSTMNKNREEAAKLTSFDAYENQQNGTSTPSVNLTKDETPDGEEKPSPEEQKALDDLAKLEGAEPAETKPSDDKKGE